jgi:23S rRNA G2069 N7-methylase RlmK/C1962 C5-methylase RlmI
MSGLRIPIRALAIAVFQVASLRNSELQGSVSPLLACIRLWLLRWIVLQQTRRDNTITQVPGWHHRWIIKNLDLYQFLKAALEACQALMEHHQALRLYNGFLEGEPRIAADLYGATLVVHNYAFLSPKSAR